MLAGNKFVLGLTRFNLARAEARVNISSEKGQNINSNTIIITLEGNEKMETEIKQSEQSRKIWAR